MRLWKLAAMTCIMLNAVPCAASLLVNVNASNLTNGSTVSQWTNTGSLGGKFIIKTGPGGTVATITAGLRTYKAVTFNNNTMMELADNGGTVLNAATVAPTIVGIGNPPTTCPVYTALFWAYQPSTTSNVSLGAIAPGYKQIFNYGGGWPIEEYDSFGPNNFLSGTWDTNCPAGLWHQIVITNSGTNQKMYIDNVLVLNLTHGTYTFLDNSTGNHNDGGPYTGAAGNPISLGGAYGNTGAMSRGFQGSVAAFQLYDTALTASDVATLYNQGPVPAPTISGTVTANGQPLSGATVAIKTSPNATVNPNQTTTTGPTGAYSFSVSPNTTYYLAATMVDYQTSGDQIVNMVNSDITGINFSLNLIPVTTGSIEEIGQANDGDTVRVIDKIVTAKPGGGVPANTFYIEEPNRFAGIRVSSLTSVQPGNKVTVKGKIWTNTDGERYIDATQVTPSAGTAVSPVGVNTKGLKRELMDGMFVRAAGKVKNKGATFYTLSDGGIDTKVLTGTLPDVNNGDMAVVTGIASLNSNTRVLLSGPVNQPPTVSAGPDQTVNISGSVMLIGTATDDGLPNGVLTTVWSKVSGPGTVTFGNPNAVNTTASFSSVGSYVLRLTASDGKLATSSTCTITVNTDPPADTSVWYKFDESSGSTASDSSGSGNNGTATGPLWVTGRIKNALRFDGTSSFVTVPDLGTASALTIATWVNLNSFGTDWASGILHCTGWQNQAMHCMVVKDTGKLRFSVNGGNPIDQDSTFAFTSADFGMWKHIAIVYDSTAKTVKFYINGALNSTNTYTSAISPNIKGAQIGDWDGMRYFDGMMDDYHIYKRALSASEISALANVAATPLFSISGKVTAQSGSSPIAGANVYFFNSPNVYANPQFTLTTDSSGNYTQTVQDGTTWYVTASATNYAMSAQQTIAVNGAAVTNANFALAAPAAGTPLVSLDASALPTGSGLMSWINTGSQGGAFTVFGSASPVVQTRGGRVCASFDGHCSLKSSVNAPSSITGSSGRWTVDILASNFAAAGTDQAMFSWARTGASGTTAQVRYGTSASNGAIYHGGATDMGFDGGLPVYGLWHHITITYDGSVEKVYVDGVLNASKTQSLNLTPGSAMFIGAGYNFDGTNYSTLASFQGSIASIKVYGSAYTAAQVAALASDSDLQISLDASGLAVGALTNWANTGCLGGSFTNDGTSPTVGTVGGLKCVTFDGSSRMKSTFNAPSSITGSSAWSVVAWVYNPAIGSEEAVFSWSKRGGANGTNAQINYGNSSSSGAVSHGGSYDMGYLASAPAAGAWHCIAVTYDGATEKVYVDGVLNSSAAKTLNITSALPCYLGCAYDGAANQPSNYFSGSINQLRVFNRSLSSEEIRMCATKTIRVYLLGGQSNATGVAPVSGLTPDLSVPQKNAIILVRGGGIGFAGGYGFDYVKPRLGDNSGCFGPEITFARDMTAAHAGEMIAIIKCAWGGTNLMYQWRPPTSVAQSGGTVGDLYNSFVAAVNEGMGNLSKFYTPDIKGMIWMQGEADALMSDAYAAYETNLTNLIGDLRTQFGKPNMPFVIAQISDAATYNPPNWGTQVRQAQANVAAHVPNTYMFTTPVSTYHLQDAWHYDAPAMIMLGSNFATGIKSLE